MTAEGLIKFPRTAHLFWLGEGAPRGDRLLAPAAARRLMSRPVAVEEKIDGSNLGLSVGANGRLRAQSRGRYLKAGTGGQYQPLWRWLALAEERLQAALGTSLLAFGEWCYARHTMGYDALPDWFLLFDVYERAEKRFWSRERRDAWARGAGLAVPPVLATGVLDRKRLTALLGASRLGRGPAEGLYLRWDEGGWVEARAKIVRRDWVPAGDEHWKGTLEINRIAAIRRSLPAPQGGSIR